MNAVFYINKTQHCSEFLHLWRRVLSGCGFAFLADQSRITKSRRRFSLLAQRCAGRSYTELESHAYGCSSCPFSQPSPLGGLGCCQHAAVSCELRRVFFSFFLGEADSFSDAFDVALAQGAQAVGSNVAVAAWDLAWVELGLL
jgi:hypothetical protein